MALTFHIPGQIPSGKNAVVITRTGKRFPNARFKKWRDMAMEYLPEVTEPIDNPVSVTISYTAGDLRRRDVPGMIDALWHLMELKINKKSEITKDGIITDDKFLGGDGCFVKFINKGIDRGNPGVIITIHN